MNEVHQTKWDNWLGCGWERYVGPQGRVNGVPQVPPKKESKETPTLLGRSRMTVGEKGRDMTPNMGTTW